MKKKILKWNSLFVGMLIIGSTMACNSQGNETAQDNEPAPVDGVAEPVPTPPPGDVQEITQDVNGTDAVLAEYMDVKNALVEDDFEEAKEEAKNLQEEVKSLEAGGLSEQQKQELQNTVSQLAAAQDIESQRQSFHVLSRQLYSLANGDLTDKTLYWQHCPMAMNNKGANWLSFEEEVQNPFMGQSMPKCGSVKETLNN